MSTFFESVPNGTLGFQIQKIRIWIESIESFLRVGPVDSKSFFGFAQRNRKSALDSKSGFGVDQRNAPPPPPGADSGARESMNRRRKNNLQIKVQSALDFCSSIFLSPFQSFHRLRYLPLGIRGWGCLFSKGIIIGGNYAFQNGLGLTKETA